MKLGQMVAAVILAASALIGPSVYANDSAGISGAAFTANSGADAPFIGHASGSVYNSDTGNARWVVADLGSNWPAGTFKVTIIGLNNGVNQECDLWARDQATGNAHDGVNFNAAIGNVTYNVSVTLSVAHSALSLSCRLPAVNANGTSYIHAVVGPN